MRSLAFVISLCRRYSAGWGLVALLALVPQGAPATPLDKASCAKLAQAVQNMKALDVDKLMEHGPTWAASHLSPADLGLVRQYIDLDEQMKFRCSAPSSLVHLNHLDEDEDESGQKPQAQAAEDEAKKAQSGDGEEAAPAKAAKKKPALGAAAKQKKPGQQPADADR
jgi:hypothetical protein